MHFVESMQVESLIELIDNAANQCNLLRLWNRVNDVLEMIRYNVELSGRFLSSMEA